LKDTLKNTLKRITFETLFILIAVLLGFIVNEMRENHNEQKKTEALIQTIQEEIVQFRLRLEDIIPKQEVFMHELIASIRNTDDFVTETARSILKKVESPFILAPLSFLSLSIAQNSPQYDRFPLKFKYKMARMTEALTAINGNSLKAYEVSSGPDAYTTERTKAILECFLGYYSTMINNQKYMLQLLND